LSLKEFRNCWLPFLPPFPTHHSVQFNVDVIALGWKGLASNDAKKKKKKHKKLKIKKVSFL